MPDNDIAKAAECCFVNKSCAECPFDMGVFNHCCITKLKECVVDLINRQGAEIIELKRHIENLELEAELKWEREVMQDDR